MALAMPFAASLAFLAAPAEGSGGIIALVNGRAITRDYFLKRVSLAEAVPLAQRDAVLREQYERMIDEQVLLDLAKREDLKVSDSEIDQRVREEIQWQRRTNRVNIADEDDYYRAVQERHGLHRDEWREEIRNELLIEKLYRSKGVFRVQIFSAEEMRAYYRNHPKEFLKGGEIVFRRISIPRDLEGRERILQEIEAQIAAGAPFPTLAARYAFGGSASEDGLLRAVYGLAEGERPESPAGIATVGFESLTPALREALERLKPGETSGRIELRSSTLIVRVESSLKPVRLSFEEALPAIRVALRRQYWEERRKEFVKEVRARADVKTFF